MRVKTTVSALTRAELVCLLSAATYNSDQFHIRIDGGFRPAAGQNPPRFREDAWADALLIGGHVIVSDLQAEGEVYGHGNFQHNPDDPEITDYFVNMAMIQRGLAAAIDGDFEGDEDDRKQALEAWRDFAADRLDNGGAETLLQVIVFNEIIYA